MPQAAEVAGRPAAEEATGRPAVEGAAERPRSEAEGHRLPAEREVEVTAGLSPAQAGQGAAAEPPLSARPESEDSDRRRRSAHGRRSSGDRRGRSAWVHPMGRLRPEGVEAAEEAAGVAAGAECSRRRFRLSPNSPHSNVSLSVGHQVLPRRISPMVAEDQYGA
jgi:hypothetical protein